MQNVNKKRELPLDDDVDFFIELCLEFSQILYDISEENVRAYCDLLTKNQELTTLCEEYEKKQGSISGAVKIRLRQIRNICRKMIKQALKKVAKTLFVKGKYLANRLGIKDKIKQMKLYRMLYSNGFIDKLRR